MNSTHQADNGYYLYGSPVSYYTVKVRSYLLYKGLHFSEIRASDKVAKNIIKPATGGWRVVPVLTTPQGDCIQDSSIILDELESAHKDRSITPPGLKQQVVSSLFELLGDEWLVFPAMHYRWNFKRFNLIYILNAFGQTRKAHWPKAARFLGGVVPALKYGNVPRFMLGINKTNTSALEAWALQLLDQLDCHFSQYDYLLGGRPCYGDFSLYGPLHAHLALDPYPKKHLIQPRKHLLAWLERMDETPQHIADWLPGDNIPETLVPILQWQCRDQLHHIHQLMDKTADWINKNPEADTLPRFIGKADYRMNDAEGKRLCTPYSQWMYERVLAPIEKAAAEQRAELTRWLDRQNIPFKPIQPNYSLMFQRSVLWRRDRLRTRTLMED
ncbi:glutathione S-transferase [Halieaceae bacterium IMCC14734]|uniref:Glutathione S-transferase n=1 Tax=Candidatus Litorirhabdus singularis TaxID=2518993 RepID=A0ABT3TKU0_9GAMM|nr:glutathione S-transferase family protein [Candidatus Litorirhabdus singularis]MCX2982933.1 glutathione S-transferase [Candidatus Litorirhabdus singularis]